MPATRVRGHARRTKKGRLTRVGGHLRRVSHALFGTPAERAERHRRAEIEDRNIEAKLQEEEQQFLRETEESERVKQARLATKAQSRQQKEELRIKAAERKTVLLNLKEHKAQLKTAARERKAQEADAAEARRNAKDYREELELTRKLETQKLKDRAELESKYNVKVPLPPPPPAEKPVMSLPPLPPPPPPRRTEPVAPPVEWTES